MHSYQGALSSWLLSLCGSLSGASRNVPFVLALLLLLETASFISTADADALVTRTNCPRLQLFVDGSCRDALPSCQLTRDGSRSDCWSPSSCECLQQCEEVWILDAQPGDMGAQRHARLNNVCFFSNGTLLGSLDDALSKQWHVYRRTRTVEPGSNGVSAVPDPAAGKPTQPPLGLTSLANCDASCNLHGWCRHPKSGFGLSPKPQCQCFQPWFGPNCSNHHLHTPHIPSQLPIPTNQHCLNNCSGRGACDQGMCLCQGEAYGVDCSLPLLTELPGADVFIYQLPPGFNVWWAHNDDRDLAVHVHEYLLRSPHRTADPAKAKLFWVPVAPNSASGRLSLSLALLALDYVRQAYPYYNRSGGRDHAIVYGWDQGSCWISRHPLAIHTIQISSFGLDRSDPKSHCDCPLCGPAFSLLVPDIMEQQYKRRTKMHYGREDATPRPTGIYFAGSQSGAERTALFRAAAAAAPGGAWNASAPPALGPVVLHHMRPGAPWVDFARGMSESKFCLALPGSGFGTRGSLALLLGCVPVFIGDLRHPWDDVLDYSAFSLTVRLDQLPRLVEIVGAADYPALRRGVGSVWHMFSWASVVGAVGGEPARHDAMHLMLARARALAQRRP